MRHLSLLLCSLALICPTAAHAQRVDQLPARSGMMAATPQQPVALSTQIAAIVNDNIISTNDLKNRVKLAAFSSGLPNTHDVVQKLLPRVMRSLINEQLQLQEGRRKGLTVSKKELDAAIERLAIENKVPGGDMEALLMANGISVSALRAQVKAGLTWKKVVLRTVRPRVDIGEDEIDSVVERLRAQNGKDEFLVSEIFLAVDKQQDEAEVRALAQQLVDQLHGGAVFGAVAREFSQGLGASTGGDLGWIQSGQLSTEVSEALSKMEKSSIAGPVRSPTGYHILGLRNKRTISTTGGDEGSVHLKQAFRAFTPTTNKEALLSEAAAIRAATVSCDGLENNLTTSFPDWRLQDLGEIQMAEAPEWLADQVRSIPQGQAGAPMATGKGALMVFVCNRTQVESINRDAIRTQLGTEKMGLLARRLERDLRRDAYIDIRLK